MSKISIIVPTHNSIKYIEECLDSIISQDFTDIEILCIDSSSDQTPDYISSVSEKDSRVRLILDDNPSWGHKLNVGIDNATGKWIMFVDSDDIQSQGMVRNLYAIAEDTGVDIVRSDFYWLFELDGKNHLLRRRFHIEPEYYDRVIDCEKEPEFRKQMFGHHWACIYRKSLFTDNDIKVNESPGASYQDVGLWIQAVMCARRVYYHTKPYYQYRIDNNSSSIRNMSKCRSYITENLYAFNEVDKRGLIRSTKDLEMMLAYRLDYYEMVHDRLEGEALYVFLESTKEDIDKIAAAYPDYIALYAVAKPQMYKLLTYNQDAVSKYEESLNTAKSEFNEIVLRMKKASVSGIILCGTGYSAFLAVLGNRLSGCADFTAVCDNTDNDIDKDSGSGDKALWLDRYKVMSSEEAADKYPDALYVIACADCDAMTQEIMRNGISEHNIISFRRHLSFETVYEMEVT